MKKTLAVFLVVASFIVGWVTASVITHRNFEKIQQGWSPDFQKIVAENVEFCKGLTRAEMEQLRQDIRDYKSHAIKETEIQTLWEAVLATQIQSALAKGDTNRVRELLTGKITRLKEAHAAGRFKGTDSEKLADSLVRRMETGTNSSTTGRTVLPEAGASGVQ